MTTPVHSDLAHVARELRREADASVATAREALDAARDRLDRLRRSARDYRDECGAGAVPRSAEELRRRHLTIDHLDVQAAALARAVEGHAGTLDAALERLHRCRSSESALRALRERGEAGERAEALRREADALDATCALSAGLAGRERADGAGAAPDRRAA